MINFAIVGVALPLCAGEATGPPTHAEPGPGCDAHGQSLVMCMSVGLSKYFGEGQDALESKMVGPGGGSCSLLLLEPPDSDGMCAYRMLLSRTE